MGETSDIVQVTDDDAIEIGEWRRVSKLTIAAQTLRTMVQGVIPAIIILYSAARDENTSEVFGYAALFAIPVLLLILSVTVLPAWLQWYRLRYRVGSSDVRLEQGIISRSARSVPYDRIQDVSLEQKLIPRLLGLVEVKFETGAAGKDELKLALVTEEEGERLRETVRELVEGSEDQALAALPATGAEDAPQPAVQPEGRVLFAMDQRRLMIFGLFSFSLVIFAVILGAAQQLEFLLPFDVWDYAEQYIRDEGYFEAGKYVDGMDTAARILGIVYLLLTVVVVGMVSGIAKTFVRDWGFKLERTAKGFRRRRGLLTKTDVVMPVHRVQALVLSTGFIRRRFGWHGLSFISLAQDSGKANHDVAPFAKMDEIEPIVREAGFTLPDGAEEWRRPSPNYYFDRAVITALVISMVGIFAFTAAIASAGQLEPGMTVIAIAVLAVITLIVAREFYLWRYDRHALDPAQVLSRRGWLGPRTQIANRIKLHSVEIAQGPLARWRGYCNLKFGMAGGNFAFNGLNLDDARKLRGAVLDSIASVDFANLPR